MTVLQQEKAFIASFVDGLRERLVATNDSAETLLIVVLLLVNQMHGVAIHASGKFVGSLISFMRFSTATNEKNGQQEENPEGAEITDGENRRQTSNISNEFLDMLQDAQKLVVKSLLSSSSSTSATTNNKKKSQSYNQEGLKQTSKEMRQSQNKGKTLDKGTSKKGGGGGKSAKRSAKRAKNDDWSSSSSSDVDAVHCGDGELDRSETTANGDGNAEDDSILVCVRPAEQNQTINDEMKLEELITELRNSIMHNF